MPLATTADAAQPILITVVGAGLGRQITRHPITDARQIHPLHPGRILQMVTVVGAASETQVQHPLIVATPAVHNPPHSQPILAVVVGDALVILLPLRIDSSRKPILRMKAFSAQTRRIVVHALWNRSPGSSNSSPNNNNRKWSSGPSHAAIMIRARAAWNAVKLKVHG